MVDSQPKTVKAMLREAGVPLGGAIRASISKAIDDALFEVWEEACYFEGGETGAKILFAIVSYDPTFRPPLWLKLRLQAHKAAIQEAVQNGEIRRARYALESY